MRDSFISFLVPRRNRITAFLKSLFLSLSSSPPTLPPQAPIFAQLPPEEAEIVLAFRSPKFMASLATHAETRDFLQQPDFMAIYKELQEDPLSLQKHLGDPRILKVQRSSYIEFFFFFPLVFERMTHLDCGVRKKC